MSLSGRLSQVGLRRFLAFPSSSRGLYLLLSFSYSPSLFKFFSLFQSLFFLKKNIISLFLFISIPSLSISFYFITSLFLTLFSNYCFLPLTSLFIRTFYLFHLSTFSFMFLYKFFLLIFVLLHAPHLLLLIFVISRFSYICPFSKH